MPNLRATLIALPLLACALMAPAAHAAAPSVQGFGGGVVEANSIAADADGNAYVLAAEGAPIAKISPTGAKSSINFPDSIGPNIRLRGLTHGPDGALWFSYNGLLTRVTQAGVRTDFPVAAGARPVVGADGNLWFPESDTGMIARVTPTGLISRFPGASPGPLSALALGPDGNLWYANATAGTIGRVSAAGIITELPVPEGWYLSPGSRIASDGDNGLWVVLTDRIGHMDLAGHALGAFYAGLAPSSIALGADGNLWFVTLFVSAIGWITPTGQVHELTAPFVPYGQPSDIAAAGDGSLWATDFTNPSVWRIRPAQQSAATGAASAVRTDGATIAGLVTPRGTRTTVTFEYGTTSSYGATTPEQDAGAGEDLVRLTATLKGLQPATTYHYRVVTRSGVGTVRGDDETFTTLALPAVKPRVEPHTDPHTDPPKTVPPAVVAQSGAAAKLVPVASLTLKPDARWERRGKAVVFTRLQLGAVPAGARLTLACRGGGCTFATYTTVLRKATKSINLLKRLQGSKLRRGATVELRLAQDGHIGRVVRWTIGATIRTKSLCLAPGAKAPGACPTT